MNSETFLRMLPLWLTGAHGGRAYNADTREGYERDITHWAAYCALPPAMNPLHAEPLHVDAWVTSYRADPRSRARAVSAVRSYYAWLIEQGVTQHNPALPILRGSVAGLPSGPRITGADAAELRSTADCYRGQQAERARAVVYGLLAGLRPGQLAGMLLEVSHHEQYRTTWDVPAKGGGTRLLELPAPLCRAIEVYLPHRVARAPHSTEHAGPLFTSRTGRPLDAEMTVRRILTAVTRTAEGTPAMTPDAVAHCPDPPFRATPA